MIKITTTVLLALSIPAMSVASQRQVHFTGDFETGRIQAHWSSNDGFFVHTVPDPQSGTEHVSSKEGGFGPDSGLDTRVVKSEKVGGETIRPRGGNHFVRSALYYNKDYSKLNGGKNKPRSKIYINHGSNHVDFDEEGYLGFSIYLPKNWEHETAIKDSRGTAQLLQVQSASASTTMLTLRIYVPEGKSVARWFLTHNVSDKSVTGGKRIEYDLGSVKGDLGKWTDFVLRYRFNPFKTKTNASSISGGKDKVYKGNKGILQLWKAKGSVDAAGNREMHLTPIDFVNKPVGLVPHASKTIGWHFRIYKYGWHNNPTNVKGPVWVGFDEIRDGRASRNGTTYSDVHPAGLACTNSCPRNSEQPIQPDDAHPRPPRNLVVVD